MLFFPKLFPSKIRFKVPVSCKALTLIAYRFNDDEMKWDKNRIISHT